MLDARVRCPNCSTLPEGATEVVLMLGALVGFVAGAVLVLVLTTPRRELGRARVAATLTEARP